MSTFLGYIHYLMYDKIQFQETLTKALLPLSNAPEAIKNTLQNLGEIEKGDLEDLIDTTNIHSWLQERVQIAESHLAYTVRQLIKENPSNSEKILKIMKQLGEDEGFSGNAKEAYQYMTSKFLDGMPCDGALVLLKNSEKEILFQVAMDVHRSKYHELTPFYWEMRSAFMEGLLFTSSCTFYSLGEATYALR